MNNTFAAADSDVNFAIDDNKGASWLVCLLHLRRYADPLTSFGAMGWLACSVVSSTGSLQTAEESEGCWFHGKACPRRRAQSFERNIGGRRSRFSESDCSKLKKWDGMSAL